VSLLLAGLLAAAAPGSAGPAAGARR